MSSVVPDGWVAKTLGDLSKVKRGASPRPIQDTKWWGGKVGWTRISDVTSSVKYLTKTRDRLSDEGVKKSVQIPKGEVILSICATIGRPIIVKTDVCIHDGFVWFDGLQSDIDREFYYYFLSSKEQTLASSRQTGTQGNLNTDIVSRLPICLPPLPEQKKIASILTSVDDVIENTQKQINKLQDLKKATMNELLTKGIGHTEFKDSELGRIPKSWDVRSLDELLDKETKYPMRSGPFGSSLLKHELVPEGVPFLGIDNVHVEEFRGNYKRFITKEKFIELSRYEVFPEDLIVTIMGTVGRCCIIPNDVRQAISSKHTWVLTFDKKLVMPHLVCWQINHSNWVLKHFADNSQGGVMDSISSETLKKTVVPVPPLEEQRAILKAYLELGNLRRTLLLKLHQTQSLKKSLMQDLLTGKVRVTVN
jgi:type I restriction enzyme S subunit